MIKLSDYLDYLNNEIIQARKMADENAIRVAKMYAEHPQLKYFRVPRYSMPSIKMDVPIKISDIDTEDKYEFEVDRKQLLTEVNDKILRLNIEKKMNIPPLTDQFFNSPGMLGFFKSMENPTIKKPTLPVFNVPIRVPVNPSVLNISEVTNPSNFKMVKPINVTGIVKSLDIKYFKPLPTTTDNESVELRNLVSESLESRYKLVSSKLNTIYIDPDTSKNDDKDKLFLNLHVEMEEEGIRLVRIQDDKGNSIEEITFE